MRLAWLVLAALPAAAGAQQQEIQRALIERDQQSAEFAARLRGAEDVRPLQALHERQLREALVPLSPDPGVAQQLLPYQRGVMAQERQRFASPVSDLPKEPSGAIKPLPLPRSAAPGVDAVTPDSFSR
jgi:hypothetical protein